MQIEEILAKIEEVSGHVTQHAGYWKARCPAHDDRDPSLSIRVKDNGWAALKCHGGCEQDDILAALGLKNIDLLTTAVNFGEPDVTYTYQAADGSPLFQVLRFPGKRFRQRHYNPEHEDADKDGWVWKVSGDLYTLYHLPEVIEGVKKGRTIYVVEGEKDVETLREKWGVVATCNPGGAGKWRKEYSDLLAGATVIIIRDKGTASERKHAEDIRTSLQGVATGGIYLMQAKVGKDVTDHIEQGYRPEDLESVKETHRRGIISAREMAAQAMDDLHTTEYDIPGYVLTPEIPLVFRQGRTYVIGAYTGHGKTSYALPGFRRLAEQHERVGFFTLEMPERDLRNKLLAHKGIPLSMTEEPWKIKNDPAWLELYTDAVKELESWPCDIIFESNITARQIKEITEEREYSVIFIDHIHKFAWADRRQFESQIQEINSIALELNVCVVVLCQLKKFDARPGAAAYPRPTLQSFRETSVLAEEASMCLAIWRQTNDEGTSFTGQTMAFVLKNRHQTGGHDAAGKAFLLHYDMKREMFVPQSEGVHTIHAA